MPKVIPPTWDNPKWQFPRHYKPLTLESFDVFKRTKKGDRKGEGVSELRLGVTDPR